MNRLLFTKIWLILLTLGLIFFTPTSHGVFCLPTDPSVAAGSATFSNPDPNTLQINASNQAIINYGSFSIGQGESVIVQLPSLDSSILNRVLGSGASDLLGNLSCNGLFILVNPNGIFIGPNAFINVGSFIASTRNITDSNFLSSQYVFEKMSEEQLDMLLRNQGTITVRDGGFGVLIAGAVENQGTIIAKVGTIALAGGDKVTLNMAGNSLISVAIDAPTAATIIDKDGKPITNQIKNSGTLQADGGMVVLKAASLPGIFINAINLEGYITANKFDEYSGKIVVLTERDVLINATLEASKIIIGKAGEAVPENVDIQGGSLIAEESVTVLANNNVTTKANITAETGDVRLFADYDGDGAGEFTQQAGVIEAKGNGNVYVDGSETMTLGEIRTEEGTINIGTQRTPEAIAGEPKYVHTAGNIKIIEKERINDVVTIQTDRGDILKYNPNHSLTLEATAGLIQDLTLTPLAADYLRLIANGFIVNSSALTTELYKNTGDLVIRSSTLQDSTVALEGEGINVIYLKDNNITLRSDNAVRTSPGVIIQAAQVKVIANQFGTQEVPLNVQANYTYINRLNGNIDIMESLGLGSSIMLRGPPDGFGYIIYSHDTNLYLDAFSVNLLSTDPTYLYGNITFNNFNCTIPGKEIYFESGHTYTFTGSTNIQGAPTKVMKLYSSESGSPWYIYLADSEYTINSVTIRDSYNIGKAVIFVPYGSSRGTNLGWYLDPVWQGGDLGGNFWSIAANWLGGVPGPADDAIFDGGIIYTDCIVDIDSEAGTLQIINGFTGTLTLNANLQINGAFSQDSGTFTVNTGGGTLTVSSFTMTGGTFRPTDVTLYCLNDFTLTAPAIFTASNSTIYEGDIWSTAPGTFNAGTSTVIFYDGETVATNTPITSGTNSFYKLTFNSASGLESWVLQDALTVTNLLTLTSGTLTTNSQTVTIGKSTTAASYSQVGGTFNAGASAITCYGDYAVTGGTYNAETSTLTLDAIVADLAFTGGGYTFNNVVFKNSSAVADRVITLGSNTTYTFAGYLYISADAAGAITLNADTNDPNIHVYGNLDFTGAGGGTQTIQMGPGSWTIEGSVDFTGGTIQAGTSNLILEGANWGSLSGGLSGAVYAMTVWDDPVAGEVLIVGGNFLHSYNGIIEIDVNNIAQWDGTQWSALNVGVNNVVRALTVYQGNLVAAGDFSGSGVIALNRVGQWNGIAWSPVADGFNDLVRTLAVYNNILFAGGDFTAGGGGPGPALLRIAQWDGIVANWLPVGDGFNSSVYALTVYDDPVQGGEVLIAGGTFSETGSIPMDYISQWDGVIWEPIGMGISPSILDGAYALTAYNDPRTGLEVLIAGGHFNTAGGVAVSNIAQWDGTDWAAMGSGANDTVRALLGNGSELIAAGDFTQAGGIVVNRVARWNGATSAWSNAGIGIPTQDAVGIYALGAYDNQPLAVGDDRLFTGGSFNITTGVANLGYIGQWPASATFITTATHTLNDLTIRNDSSFAQTVVISGALNLDGNLYLEAATGGDIWLGNPTDLVFPNPVVIAGDIDFIGAGSGTENLYAGDGDWSVAGNINFSGGTFNAGLSEFTLNGSADQNITPNNQAFYDLIVDNDGIDPNDDIVISGALDVNNDLTINNGNLDLDTTTNVGGNLSIAAGGEVTKGSGTWTFDGNAQSDWNDNTASGQDIGNVLIEGTAKTVILRSIVNTAKATSLRIGVDDTLDLSQALPNKTFTLTGTGTGPNAPLIIAGGGSLDIADSTVVYAGSGADTSITVCAYNNLTVGPNPVAATNYLLTGDLSAITSLAGSLTIGPSATLDVTAADFGIALAGDWTNNGSFNPRAGKVIFSGGISDITTGGIGAGKIFHDVDIASGTKTLVGDINIDGDFTIAGGTFDADGNDIYVAGDWDNSAVGAIFTPGAGTVIFDGGSADIITGGTGAGKNFNHVEINATTGLAPTKTLGGAINIDGNFTITAGTFDVSGSNYDMVVSGDWDNDHSGAFNARGGTVIFNGNSIQQLNSGGTGADHDFFNLHYTGTDTLLLENDLRANGEIYVYNDPGTFDATTNDISITAGSLTIGEGIFLAPDAPATVTINGNCRIGGTAIPEEGNVTYTGGSGAITITGDLDILTNFGTTTLFTAGSGVIEVNGQYTNFGSPTVNWTINDGKLYMNSTTNQTLPDNTYHHLELGGTATYALGGVSTNIEGNLDIDTDATLDASVTPAYAINLMGNWNNDGIFIAGTSMVTFNGTAAQTIYSGYAADPTENKAFWGVTINNPLSAEAVTVSDEHMKMRSLLVEVGAKLSLADQAQVWVIGGLTLNETPVYAPESCIIYLPPVVPGDLDYLYYGGTTGINKNDLIYDFFDGYDVFIKAGRFPQDELAEALSLTIDTGATYAMLAGNLDVGAGGITIDGTLDGANTISLEGDWDNTNGVFNPNASLVLFDGGSANIITGGIGPDKLFNDVEIASSGTKTLIGDIAIGGTLDITAGILNSNSNDINLTGVGTIDFGATLLLDAAASSSTLNIFNTFTNNGTLTIENDANAVSIVGVGARRTFTGTDIDYNTNSVTLTNIDYDPDVSLDEAGDAIVLGDANCLFDGISIGAGTIFNATGNAFVISGNFTNNALGTLTTTGTVTFDGGTGITQLLNAGGIDENHNFMNLVHNGAGTLRLTNALSIDGNFSNSAGAFDANANAVTFTAAEAGHTINAGNSASFYDVDFNGVGGGWTLIANLDVNRDLFITNGTLSAGNNNINIARDLTIAAGTGTFIPNTSTVIFDNSGYISHILGTTFYNLTCTTPNKRLEFQPAPVIETIQNILTLNGGNQNTPIILNSTDGATRFTFDVTGGQQTVYYVSVSNSQSSTNDIIAHNSFDLFNTDSGEPSPHWIFVRDIEPPRPPNDPNINQPFSYEDNEWLKKKYPKGKYRTTVIVYEGRVVVAPYDEHGVRYDEATVLTGGQKVAVEGWVK